MKSTDELKGVNRVILKADRREYFIYTIYDYEHLSLCLFDYSDVEQDFQTHISEIELIKEVVENEDKI